MIVSLISCLQRRSSFKPFWRGDLFYRFYFFIFLANCSLLSFYFCFFKPFRKLLLSSFFAALTFCWSLEFFHKLLSLKTNIFDPLPSFREAELSPAQREELLRQLSQWPTKQVQLFVTFLLFTCFFFGENQGNHLFCLFSIFVFLLLFLLFCKLVSGRTWDR